MRLFHPFGGRGEYLHTQEKPDFAFSFCVKQFCVPNIFRTLGKHEEAEIIRQRVD